VKEHCREVLARAYLFLDGEGLSEAERIEIEVHLEECVPCLDSVDLQRDVRTLISRIGGATPCPDAVRTKIIQLIDQA
jgi:mycothiol system anti-sigma-R factor